MIHQNALVAILAVPLFLYFFLRPEGDFITYGVIFGIWSVGMTLDLLVTFGHKSYIPKYEQSLILSFLYGKFSKVKSILFTILIESACVILFPVMIYFEIDLGLSTVIAFFFATLHAVAISHNEKFVNIHKIQTHHGLDTL